MSSRVPRLQLNRLPRIHSQPTLARFGTRSVARHRCLLLLAAILAALAAATLLRGGLARRTARKQYVLVIDAGSSGTRLFAYTWQDGVGAAGAPLLEAVPTSAAPHKVPRRAMPSKRAYQRVETEPGLDKFVDDSAGLQDRALGPLLDWAEAVVPPRQWQQTPVFLFGTAGLRKLSGQQQAGLLAGVRQVLEGSSFAFQPPWARIISGADEGVYGWIALNYLAGTLQGGNSSSGAGSGSGTLGALDLGGSSLEVTFAAGSVPWEEDAVNATVMGISHQLYAHVHHHYGLNDAFDRSVSILLSRMAPGGSSSDSPDANRAQQQQQHQQSSQHQGEEGAGEGDNAPHDTNNPSNNGGSAGGSGASTAAQQAGVVAAASIKAEEEAGHSSSGGSATSESRSSMGDADVDDSRSAAEKAGVVALKRGAHHAAAEHADAAGADGSVTASSSAGDSAQLAAAAGGHRRRVLQVPEALQRRLQLTVGALAASDADAHTAANAVGGGQQLEHQRQLLAELLEVPHPCLHDGYRQPYKRLRVEGAALPDPPEVVLLGRSDFGACQELARAVVNATVPCSAPPCALGTPQPSSAGHRFVALSGFYVVNHFYRLPDNASLAELVQAGQRFCASTWDEVQRERPGELMVEHYCFRAPYVEALLTQGLLLADGQLQIGSGDVGWTLGAALAEGYRLAGLGRPGDSSVWLSRGSWLVSGLSSRPLLLAGAMSSALALYALVQWRRRPPGSSGLSILGRSGAGVAGTLSKLQAKASTELLPTVSPDRGAGSGASSLASSVIGLAGLVYSPQGSSRTLSPLTSTRVRWSVGAGGGYQQQSYAGSAAGSPTVAGTEAVGGTLAGSGQPRSQAWGPLAPMPDATMGSSSHQRDYRLGRSLSRRALATSADGE